MEYWFVSVLSIMISVLVTYYLFRKLNFFKRHGIIHIASIPILGAMASIIFRRMSFVDFTRKIFIQQFESRRKKNWILRYKSVLCSVIWHVKNLLSPSILLADKSDINMKDIFDRYTNDVIALCMYGRKIDSIRDPTNKFYICGKDITYMSAIRSIKYIFIRTFLKLGRIFNIKLLNNHEMKYFESRIKNEIAICDTEHVTRPDMIQLMLDNRGKEGQMQLDMDDIVAQAYGFYFAGFETSSSVMSFITYKIATNPNIQIKLQQEIDELWNESDVTYEAVNKLKYLDAVIKEALRLFSPSIMERICEKAYKLLPALPGEKSLTINKGMIIWVPLYAIHHDEKYYDNPEEFRPERFLNNHQDNNYRSSFYFPFGLGSRMCIGRRFSLLMIKVVLFHLLARCELKQCAKTSSIKFSEKNLAMMPKDGFWLNIQDRNDKFDRD
ncbi:CP9E2 protein, partial [Acromyrmex charruanus]